jgi:hypothetical protein
MEVFIMGRLTKTSIENLKVATSIQLHVGDYPNNEYWMIRAERNGNAAYLHDSKGIMLYESKEAARRAAKRVRPDLEPTTI